VSCCGRHLHDSVAPVELCHGCSCARLLAAASAAVYGQHAAAARVILQHRVVHSPVLAGRQHADAALLVHVHREVCAADEHIGHVVAVVPMTCDV
jgi:hypothetical protein